MGATAASHKLSDGERAKILEQARRELSSLDEQFKKAMTNLERISMGLRPKS